MITNCSTEIGKATPAPVIAKGNAPPQSRRTRRAVASRSHRLDWVRIGFWLGAATFGTAGGVLGGCMPYHHPVAITASVIWWGIYIGSLGASLGALAGLVLRRARPVPGSDLAKLTAVSSTRLTRGQ